MHLPNGNYIGKITSVDLEVIENDKNRNYGRQQTIFGLEITEGDQTGEATQAKRIMHPAEVQMPLKDETPEQHKYRQRDYLLFTLKQFASAGVVNMRDFNNVVAQLPRVKGNTVKFSVKDINGYPYVTINQLVESVIPPEEMIKFNYLPDGNDAPFGD